MGHVEQTFAGKLSGGHPCLIAATNSLSLNLVLFGYSCGAPGLQTTVLTL